MRQLATSVAAALLLCGFGLYALFSLDWDETDPEPVPPESQIGSDGAVVRVRASSSRPPRDWPPGLRGMTTIRSAAPPPSDQSETRDAEPPPAQAPRPAPGEAPPVSPIVLVDKPDSGGFTGEESARRFEPCRRADGTRYVGPGTALDPFAEIDPCLSEPNVGTPPPPPSIAPRSDRP